MSPSRLVGSYPTFSPLPRLNGAVIFFYVTPAVADTLHINKRDALCCPDFPHTPRGSKRQTVRLLSCILSFFSFSFSSSTQRYVFFVSMQNDLLLYWYFCCYVGSREQMFLGLEPSHHLFADYVSCCKCKHLLSYD